jgi:3-(3-hydroxy-phenyl)propionate hydroxylase
MVGTSVLVVGAGPTGLVAAALLGRAGVEAMVLERNPSTSDEPKAVTIDDAALRTLQRAGVLEELRDALLAGTGTRYYGRHGQLLTYAHASPPFRFGHPVKNPFAQPELERRLAGYLERLPSVRLRFGAELTGLAQDGEGVTARVSGPGGATEELRCAYLLGCDGGRSSVRSLLGIRLQGSSYTEPWLVIDTLNDAHDQRYAMHHGDPRQPRVVVPGPGGTCRYEFLAGRGDADLDGPPPPELVRELLAPYRPLEEGDLRRAALYTFHALVAARWRSGRCFLLGDAAHMMPPFAGAGLNAGIRDADNLTWKLGLALGEGGAPARPELLDTYELERRPHVEAMVRLSVRLGSLVMTTSPTRAVLRDLAVRLCNLVPAGRRYLAEMRFRPEARCARGFVMRAPPLAGAAVVGRALGQPTVMDPAGRLLPLDEALGPGFSLVAVDPEEIDPFRGLSHPIWDGLGASRVGVALGDRAARCASGGWRSVADYDGSLAKPLADCRGRLLLVRPDRVVAAAFGAGQERAVATLLDRWLRVPEGEGGGGGC